MIELNKKERRRRSENPQEDLSSERSPFQTQPGSNRNPINGDFAGIRNGAPPTPFGFNPIPQRNQYAVDTPWQIPVTQLPQSQYGPMGNNLNRVVNIEKTITFIPPPSTIGKYGSKKKVRNQHKSDKHQKKSTPFYGI